MPEALREYLLATGDRGIGWRAVYGDAPLSVEQYELLTWMQQRVALAATEEGRKELQRERAIEQAVAADVAAEQAARTGIAAPRAIAPPFDPETMSPGEVADWLARYGKGVLH